MLHTFVSHPTYRFFFPQLEKQTEARADEMSRWTPAVDVFETQEAFHLVFEVPGVAATDIDLKVEKDVLTVTGKKDAVEVEGATVLRAERSAGTFSRTFNLPREIDSSAIKAAYELGVLRVTLPKQAEAKPRKIEIAGA